MIGAKRRQKNIWMIHITGEQEEFEARNWKKKTKEKGQNHIS